METLPALAGAGGLSAMTALNPYTAALSALPSLFQLGLGITQKIRGNDIMRGIERPTAVVPQALMESQRLGQNAMYGGMPGLNYMQNLISGNQAAATRAAVGAGGGVSSRIGSILGAQAQANEATAGLAAQDARYRQQQQLNLQNVLSQVAAEQNRMFQYNEADPYQALVEAARREQDAGNQNIPRSLSSLGGSVASALTMGTPRTPQMAQPDMMSIPADTRSLYDMVQENAAKRLSETIRPAKSTFQWNP